LIVDPSGSSANGKVTFILTQKVWSPAGLIPVTSFVTGVLNGSGQFDVSVYPSQSLTPAAYYQVWYESIGGRRQLVGVFNIPPSAASSITLSPYAVTDTNLSAQYTFLSAAALNSLVTGLAGTVTSFNTRTGAIVPATNDYTWAQINKSTSSIADITTRSASDLSSGTLPPARLGSLTDNFMPYKTSSNMADSPLERYGSGTVGFDTGSVAAPSTGSQTTGTRLLLYPGASGAHLGLGVETGALWFNAAAANSYKFYWGASSAERYTATPSEFRFDTSGTVFKLNFQTSGTPSVSALVLSTNAYTVRVGPDPLADNAYAWDFTTSELRPFTNSTMALGGASHYLSYVFTNNLSLPGSTSGITNLHASAVAGSTTVTLPGATDTLVGKATTDTLTNKTLTSPKIGTSILDTNGNTLFGLMATASAVNFPNMASGATGTGPTVTCTGSDTNVDCNWATKGTGGFNFSAGSGATVNLSFAKRPTFNNPGTDSSGIAASFAYGGTEYYRLEYNQIDFDAGVCFRWGSIGGGSYTAGMCRATSKVIEFNDAAGNGGTFRSIPTSPSQITSNQNNYNPGGSGLYLRLNTDASRNITGLTFGSAQVDGQTHVIVNVGAQNIVLVNESASSTAANRFHNSTAADITLSADQMADCWYDATTARWRVSKRN
jgi:hypothetical protein